MPEAMTTRGDPRGFGIALHLLLDCRDRQRSVGALLVPEDGGPRHLSGPESQTGLEARHRIRGDVDASIFPAFALLDAERLLGPINLVDLEMHDLRDPQATAEH